MDLTTNPPFLTMDTHKKLWAMWQESDEVGRIDLMILVHREKHRLRLKVSLDTFL
jgi:hypothetical protein